jgi:hypothetical protein
VALGLGACAPKEETPGPQGGQGGSAGRGGAGGAGGSAGRGGGGSGGSGTAGTGSAGTGGAAGTSGGSGAAGTGGGTGGTAGTTGGTGGSGTGGAAGSGGTGMDAAAGTGGSAAGDAAADSGGSPPGDAGVRPDGMGQACATGSNYAFTVRPFGSSQTGTFTAYFTVTPSRAPTNSVIGLSDGQKYLHDAYAAIVRFGTNGMLDVRNGAAYMSMTPIQYKVTDYHFRLVVNVAAQNYAAYVSFEGMPEVTLGTNLAFRDSAGMPKQFSHWGVEAVAGSNTRVCGFLIGP